MTTTTLARNVIVAVWQIVVTGIILIVLYRLLLLQIGIYQLGIWSMVTAVASSAGIAQLGLGGSVVKFVSRYLAHSDSASAIRVIQTAAISTAVLLFVGGLLLYPVLHWIVGKVVDSESVKIAHEILLLSLTVVWINTVAGVFQSGLDGAQRIDLRGYAVMSGSLIYLLCVYILVPIYGLTGLLYSQIVQACFLLVAGLVMLGYIFRKSTLLPGCWEKSVFRDMLGYGVPFQIISLAQIYTDPITKVLLGYFGGLSAVGYYEMANRIVMQLRTLFVAANQVLIPVVSMINEKPGSGLVRLYQKSFRVTFFIAVPFFALVVSLSPLISELWIGSYEQVFVFSVCLLAISRCINTLSAPSYFSYLGTGSLRPVVTGHVYITFLNVLLGVIGGMTVPGIGVVLGWSLALSVGTMYVVVTFHKEHEITLKQMLSGMDITLLVSSVCVSLVCFGAYQSEVVQSSGLAGVGAVVALFVIVILPIMRKNPIFPEVLDAVIHRARG